MKNNSKITNANMSGNGGAVRISGGTFIMEGGTISGNKTAGYGGGVYLESGNFNMSGGSITGNTGNIGSDVYVYILSKISMLGNAQIGNLALESNIYGRGMVTVAGTFTGSVNKLDLAVDGGSSWVNGQVITAETGTLTKAMVDKFDLVLGDFISTTFVRTPIKPGYHLYGAKTGETDTAKLGTLVAD